ncbi:hypothetical protein GCM10012275_15860 [Longimycelium tulufanense]|uniref:DJ-1/PfpI domain-containing protein n=1 Tax=Longimycelium tulufanense TaxID=907463 RepID=A0A8J3FUR7_9PSEU|nr:type 1 glutamine amidotransferase domain-containing protein [Longimycelium tulufanense]GGM45629.1 hypothetical protein GCM10012275_15860 [Longimycelium tulufanense]
MATILMVLSGAADWTQNDGTKRPSGTWSVEFVVPHRTFLEAGHRVDIATPDGVAPTFDHQSLTARYAGGEDNARDYTAYLRQIDRELRAPLRLADVRIADYDAVFIPGGHSPLEDLAHDPDLGRLLLATEAEGKLVAALCHGAGGLLSANLSGGRWLFAGRRMAVFTDEEEHAYNTAAGAPWLLETMARARGAVLEPGPAFGSKVVMDGNLYTGQNPESSSEIALQVVKALG